METKMYKDDVPSIRDFVFNTGPKGLDSLFYFVIGSIRVQFLTLPAVTNSLIEEGLLSHYCWGNKITAYEDYNLMDKDKFMEDVQNPTKSTIALSQELSDIRGIGITKASFFLQLLGRDTACLDVHNLKKLGYNSKKFSKRDSAEEYHETVNVEGSEYWWDNWCETIYKGYPNHFSSAEEISKFHLAIINQEVTESFKKKEMTV
jgi:hypothetical protein